MLTERSTRPTQNFRKRVLSLPGELLCTCHGPASRTSSFRMSMGSVRSLAFSPQPGGLHFPLAPIIPPPSPSAQPGTPSRKASVSPECRTGRGAHLAHPLLLARLSPPSSQPPSFCLSPARPLSSRAFLSPVGGRGRRGAQPSRTYRGHEGHGAARGRGQECTQTPGHRVGGGGSPRALPGGPPDTARGLLGKKGGLGRQTWGGPCAGMRAGPASFPEEGQRQMAAGG